MYFLLVKSRKINNERKTKKMSCCLVFIYCTPIIKLHPECRATPSPTSPTTVPCSASLSRTLATFKVDLSVTLWKLHFRFCGGHRCASVGAFHCCYVGMFLRRSVCFFWFLNFYMFCFCSHTVQ